MVRRGQGFIGEFDYNLHEILLYSVPLLGFFLLCIWLPLDVEESYWTHIYVSLNRPLSLRINGRKWFFGSLLRVASSIVASLLPSSLWWSDSARKLRCQDRKVTGCSKRSKRMDQGGHVFILGSYKTSIEVLILRPNRIRVGRLVGWDNLDEIVWRN